MIILYLIYAAYGWKYPQKCFVVERGFGGVGDGRTGPEKP